MLISWKHHFALIHIPKTGGTSLTASLARYARPADRFIYTARSVPLVRSALSRALGGEGAIERVTGFTAHAKLRNLNEAFGQARIAPLKICAFVRNPFSRTYSLYRHVLRNEKHPHHDRMRGLDFDEALAIMLAEKWERQTDYLYQDENTVLRADFLGAFERMGKDAARLHEMLALPAPARLPHLNADQGARSEPDFAALYGDQTDAFVAHFAADFEVPGYSLDPAEAGRPPA